jgi:hypothetical protein
LPRCYRRVAAQKPRRCTIAIDVDQKQQGGQQVDRPGQEAVMGKAIPTQHPAVVLRSHFNMVRALLAIAMIGLVALTAAVVILATDSDEIESTSSPQPAVVEQPRPDGTRYDGGPEEGTRGPLVSPVAEPQAPGTRYDGGPEEGTSGITPAQPVPDTRYDGGPEEGTRGPGARTN